MNNMISNKEFKGMIERLGSQYIGAIEEAGAVGHTGEAYGFFYCNAPKYEVEEQLPQAREKARTPNKLELTLVEGIYPEHFDDPELKELAYQASNMGNNYTMTAHLPDATNEKTAHELGDIQNVLYQSPLQSKFHKDDGEFWGGIVYKEGAKYQFLE